MKPFRGFVAVISALLGVFLNAPAPAAGIVETLARVKPAVVGIATLHPTRNPRLKLLGTGFVVGDGAHVVTNSHVQPLLLDRERKETLVAVARRGDEVAICPAQEKAADPEHDLLLLSLSQCPVLPVLRIADPARAREGQTLYFTGYPLGAVLGLYPATHRAGLAAIAPIYTPPGMARGLSPQLIRQAREPFQIYQLDAVAYPGNSGSPLYDPETGEVYGVINSVFVKGAKENALSDPSGISYAIPSRYIRALMEKAGLKP